MTPIAEDVDLKAIANTYEISGTTIMNVVGYSSLIAASRNENTIIARDIISGIQKENDKEGRSFPRK